MSEPIYLSDVRLSFPHIAEPQTQTNEQTGEKRISFNAEFIMPTEHPGFAKFMQVVGAMAVEKWKEQATAVINHVNQNRKSRCYGWGQEKVNQKTFKIYDGYEDNVFITAGGKNMPQIIGPDGIQVNPADTLQVQALAREMYGGCRVNAVVKPWLQENKHGRGIRADLVAVQFFKDDTPFGEGTVDVTGLFGAAPAAPVAPGANPFAPPAPAAPAAPAWAPPVATPQQPQMPPAPFPGAGAPVAPAWAPPAWAPPAAPAPGAVPPWMQ